MSTIISGDFWAFVGVVAGIYTLFALGLQIQFGFTGLLNFGQVGFMAIGAYTMAILTVKEGMSMWLAASQTSPPSMREATPRWNRLAIIPRTFWTIFGTKGRSSLRATWRSLKEITWTSTRP